MSIDRERLLTVLLASAASLLAAALAFKYYRLL